jgi:hypothetical protein
VARRTAVAEIDNRNIRQVRHWQTRGGLEMGLRNPKQAPRDY